MLSINKIGELLANIEIHVGTLFQESDSDAFKVHLRDVMASGESVVAKRITTLFAFWSNIRANCGESVVATPDTLFVFYLLKDYRFAIAVELAHLCPRVISKVSGKEMRISSQEDFEMFTHLLKLVDEKVRNDRLTDMQAYEILMNILEEQFTD